MKNLDNIIDKELELDENIFAAAKSAGKNAWAKTKQAGRKINQKATDFSNEKDAETSSLNRKKTQLKTRMSALKQKYLKSLKSFIIAFEKAEGEDAEDKFDDQTVQEYYEQLNPIWKEMEEISTNYPIEESVDSPLLKSYWKDLHNKFLSFKKDYNIDSLKKWFDTIAEKINKSFKKTVVKPFSSEESSSDDITKDDAKTEKSTESKSSGKEDPRDTWAKIANDKEKLEKYKDYNSLAKDLVRFHNIFSESFLSKLSFSLIEEKLLKKDWEDIQRFVKEYYDETDTTNFGEVLRRWNKMSGGEVDKKIEKKYKSLEPGFQKIIDKLRDQAEYSSVDDDESKNTDASSKSDKDEEDTEVAGDKPINKKYERVKLALKEMENFDDKDDAERLKKIMKKYPDVDDDTIIGAYGRSDKSTPDSMPINIGGETFTKKEFLLMLHNLEESIILNEKMAIVPGIVRVKKLLDKGWDKKQLLSKYAKKDAQEVKPLKTSPEVQVAAQKLNKAFSKLKENPEKAERLMKKIRRQLPTEIRKRITIGHISQIFQMLTGKKQVADLGESLDLYLYQEDIINVIKEEIQ